MHPFLFEIAGFKMPAYGLMVACGYLAAIFYLFKVRDHLLTRDQTSDIIFYSALAGIIGAKTTFVLTYWRELGPDMTSRAFFVLKNFPYGFVFYGGLLAGAAAFIFYCRRHGLDFLKTADRFAPALALAHAFGRVGCFLVGCCHGRPYSGHFSVVFSNPVCEVSPAYLGVPLHPSQLYEAAGNFLIFSGLHFLSRKSDLRPGLILSVYLAAYSTLRFSVEFLRGDDRGGSWQGLSPAQILSLFLAAAALAIFVVISRKNGKLEV